MDETVNKTGAVIVGALLGGAGGFVATEGTAAFLHFVLDITPDVEGNPLLLVAFLGVPLLCAVVGAFVGLRLAVRMQGRR